MELTTYTVSVLAHLVRDGVLASAGTGAEGGVRVLSDVFKGMLVR